MTRHERITSILSGAALVVSLLALFGPLWTHVFDREMRGQLAIVWLSHDEKEASDVWTSDARSDVKARLKNIGSRPLGEVTIQVERLNRTERRPEVTVGGYALKKSDEDRETAAYQLSSKVAPSQSLDISIQGRNLRQVLVTTEHGDSTLVYAFDGGFK